VNGKRVHHGDDYHQDYLPDLILNQSISFLNHSRSNDDQPFLLFMSFPSPHGPEDAAPQYQHLFANVTTHRFVLHELLRDETLLPNLASLYIQR
jgi:extracellular sulfatase Sulf